MVFVKVESEDVKIEEHDTEQQTEMSFIIEESENMKIDEAFRVKHEDIETQTGRFHLSSVILCHESVICLIISSVSFFFLPSHYGTMVVEKNIRSKEKLYNNRLQRAPTACCYYTSQQITTPCLISAE